MIAEATGTADSTVIEDHVECKEKGKCDVVAADDETCSLTENHFCTMAVTGSNPTFQAIFLCNECLVGPDGIADATAPTSVDAQQEQQQSPLCVCQACAEFCHDDGYHDVEYVGMGPSYCDCYRMGNCKLYKKSLEEADRLGVIPNDDTYGRSVSSPLLLPSPEHLVREAFDIPILQQNVNKSGSATLALLLVEQARELIRHTKETLWIDETVVRKYTPDTLDSDENSKPSSQNRLCLLESLAWSIYRSHRERYKDILDVNVDGDNAGDDRGGAEWWVQVKSLSGTIDGSSSDDPAGEFADASPQFSSSSIDLHYDKDEALAESFGIGSFPALSTVTYLTASPAKAAPTIVFDHTYTQGEDEVMSSMFVSRPRIGKHICFDGRLLHGAPYHPSLLSIAPSLSCGDEQDATLECDAVPQEEKPTTMPLFRVTFLVNIWNHRRPASVHVLDDKIRKSILQLQQSMSVPEDSTGAIRFENDSKLTMDPLEIPTVAFEEEADLPEASRDRIELPFVSNLSEEDGEEDGEGSTVVVTFPPGHTDDSVLVTFGPGLQAYLDYNYGSQGGVDTESQDGTDLPPPARQSHYV